MFWSFFQVTLVPLVTVMVEGLKARLLIETLASPEIGDDNAVGVGLDLEGE